LKELAKSIADGFFGGNMLAFQLALPPAGIVPMWCAGPPMPLPRPSIPVRAWRSSLAMRVRPRMEHRESISGIRTPAMSHPFRAGQRVQLSRNVRSRNAAVGSYEILRQLPTGDDGERQYRLKSADESHERVAKESELEEC